MAIFFSLAERIKTERWSVGAIKRPVKAVDVFPSEHEQESSGVMRGGVRNEDKNLRFPDVRNLSCSHAARRNEKNGRERVQKYEVF